MKVSSNDDGAVFSSSLVSQEIYNRIEGKSYKPGESLPIDDLRYVTVAYYDYNGVIKQGS